MCVGLEMSRLRAGRETYWLMYDDLIDTCPCYIRQNGSPRTTVDNDGR
jgi:hypothetical protein